MVGPWPRLREFQLVAHVNSVVVVVAVVVVAAAAAAVNKYHALTGHFHFVFFPRRKKLIN